MRRGRGPGVVAIGVIGAASVMIGACAGEPASARALSAPGSNAAPPASLGTDGSARERLRRAASEERPRPFPPEVDVASRIGVEPVAPAPGDRAALTLDEAIADWRARLVADQIASNRPAPVPAADRAAALDLLQAARGSDAETALAALNEAARLDPSEPAIALEQFRLFHRDGRRSEALDAARRAAGLGAGDQDVLLAIALEAGSQDTGEALDLLAMIDRGTPLSADVGALARIAGGETLLGEGYTSAGGRLLVEGLDSLTEPSPESAWRRDIVRAIARSDELRVLAGDALLAAGDHESASRAYAGAAGADDAAGRRAAFAMLLAGRRAGAAELVIGSLSRAARVPTTFDRNVLRLSAEGWDELARVLSGAVVETRDENADLGVGYRDPMTMLAAELLGDREGAELLRDRLLNDAARAEPARMFLGLEQRRGRAVEACIELTRDRPDRARMWAAALLGGDEPAADFIGVVNQDSSWAARLLLAGIELQRQRPHEAYAVLEGIGLESGAPNAPLDRLLVEAGVASGRWDGANRALARLQSNDNADPVVVLGALRIAQRTNEAYQLGESLVSEREPTVELLLEMTELASLRGDAHDAELFLQIASELDRYDERIYAARLLLYAPTGPLPDETQQTSALRELRQRLPESSLAALHDAGDLANAGLYEEAETRLRAIGEADPDENAAFEMLLAVWGAMGEGEADVVFDDAGEWLGSLLDRRPASPAVGAALVRLQVRRGWIDEALETIDRVEAGVGAPVLAPLRERILTDQLKAEDRAIEHALARLNHPTLSIDDGITRAGLEILSEDRSVRDAASTLAASLPEGVTLTPEQGRRLIGVVAQAAAPAVGPDAEAPDSAEWYALHRAPLVALIEIARGHVELNDAIKTQYLRFKAQDPDSTPESLASLLETTAGDDEAFGARAYTEVLGELIRRRKYDGAARVAALGAVQGETLDAGLLLVAIQVVGRFGERDGIGEIIRTLDEHGRTEAAAELFWDDAPPVTHSPESIRAEVAYNVATQASFTGRDDLAEAAYRIALAHDPRHMWSNNDLGYMLAEQGRDLDEAERMVLIAQEIEPESSNVADSLGWVRYMQGRFEDEGDVEGAISLIRKALRLEDGGDRATLHDHLGDALWRAGRVDEAERAWLDAEQVGLAQVRDARRQRAAEDPTRARFEARLRSIRSKLLAVEADESPRVAPLPGEDEAP